MKGNIIIDVSFIFECMLSCQLRFFRVNLHSIVYLNVKGVLARSRRHIWSLCDDSKIRTRNFLVRKRTLKHLAKLNECLTKWLSVRLRTNRLWVRISLLSRCFLFLWNKGYNEGLFLLSSYFNLLSSYFNPDLWVGYLICFKFRFVFV